MKKAPRHGACSRGVAVRKPSDRNPSYCPAVHEVNVNDLESRANSPISGRLGPGTVISAEVDADLWPAWTDAPFGAVVRVLEGGC